MSAKKYIDVDYVLKSKSPTFYKLVPGFLISYLKKITHQEEINEFIENNKDLYDYKFAQSLLETFNVKLNIVNENNVKNAEGTIVASNHPLGGLDGLALLANIGPHHNVKALGNDLLMYVENLKPLFIPINKHGKNSKEYINIFNNAFESNDTIIFFPAGLVSRKKKKVIKDLEWKKSFIQRARKYKKNVLPTYVNGQNSNFFYNLANLRKFLNIKMNIEMLYLPDEMFKHKNSSIIITYGKPIPYTTFDKRMKDDEWANKVKEHVYQLSENPEKDFEYL